MGGTKGRKDPWKLELGYLVEFQVSPQVFFVPETISLPFVLLQPFSLFFEVIFIWRASGRKKSPENTIVALYAAVVKKGVNAMPMLSLVTNWQEQIQCWVYYNGVTESLQRKIGICWKSKNQSGHRGRNNWRYEEKGMTLAPKLNEVEMHFLDIINKKIGSFWVHSIAINYHTLEC